MKQYNPGPNNSPKKPNLSFEYNHDLDVSESFLARYPSIRELLRDQRLIDAFKVYDKEAQERKRAFHRIGFWSLIFGVITLITASLEVVFGNSAVHQFGIWGVVAQAGSVVSLGLAWWNRHARNRMRWCQAMFCRERLRQWHFQLFLDGALVSKCVKEPAAFKKELDERWADLEAKLENGMTSFKKYPSRADDFYHERTSYTDTSIAQSVFGAMKVLRFDHQLSFSQGKLQPEAEGGGTSLEERVSNSEHLASSTLAGAVGIGVLGFVVAIHQYLAKPLPFLEHVDVEVVNRCLGGTALFLVVLSAASRAYRAGQTLPDEIESYEEYCDRLREFKYIFDDSAATSDEKLLQLEHLEEESIAEFRRFLRMKSRATFVF